MATGAHGNPGASAAGLVVEAHRARLGDATVLHLDQEADSAVGRQPRPRGATPKHVQLQLQLRGRRADQCQDTEIIATM